MWKQLSNKGSSYKSERFKITGSFYTHDRFTGSNTPCSRHSHIRSSTNGTTANILPTGVVTVKKLGQWRKEKYVCITLLQTMSATVTDTHLCPPVELKNTFNHLTSIQQNLSLTINNHHVTKKYGWVEVQPHTFLNFITLCDHMLVSTVYCQRAQHAICWSLDVYMVPI